MKSAIIAALIVVMSASYAAAQETSQQTEASARQAALIKSGNIKIWTGAVLLAAGAFVMPLTPTTTAKSSAGATAPIGVGMMMGGGALVYLGFNDRRRAFQPHTTIGVAVGRGTEFQVRRLW